MSNKAYLYPITNRFKTGLDNPYLSHFMDSLEPDFVFLNRHHPSDTGFFNFIKYFLRADYLFFNWIEDLPDKKSGRMQTLFLFLVCSLFQWKGGKIVWTLHNKLSHYTTNILAKEKLLGYLIRHSNFILTHAQEGKAFVETRAQKKKNILVIPHPVVYDPVIPAKEPKYDFLIWGTLSPYKAVDKFLEFLKTTGQEKEFNILVAGKIPDKDYESKMQGFASENIEIINDFISKEKLKEYVSESRFILFTYHSDSVLSSGALMDAIGFGARVVGPVSGAFRELGEQQVIFCYSKYEDIPGIYKSQMAQAVSARVGQFAMENSWNHFEKTIKTWLSKKTG